MINGIILENFKCFKNLTLNLSCLNVFSGINGMGKSTIIQSLLLLKQSHKQGLLPQYISLNGDYVNIGTGRDLLYEYAEEPETISIGINDGEMKYKFSCVYSPFKDVLEVLNIPNELYKSINLFSNDFEYLNAERVSPQAVYTKSRYYTDSLNQLGNNGEYTIHYLFEHQEDSIPNEMLLNNSDNINKLKACTQYWMDQITPNIRFDIQDIDNTDLVRMGYYFTENQKSNIFRPTNVGFGISYVLPVVLALIKAKPGSIVVIENPEAHLHPQGQRKIGELISLCAAGGVQVFIETHSDHVLNGIRISVKKQKITNDIVKLFFFNKIIQDSHFLHRVEIPSIDMSGKLSYWPDGFFDEWDKALDEIL